MSSSQPKPLVLPAKRTTVVVRDLKRSREFYESCLKLEVFYEGFVGNPGASSLLGYQCEGLNMVVLQSDHPQLGMIGLMEVVEPDPPLSNPKPGGPLAYGETVIVIPTSDMTALMGRLKAAEADIIGEPVRLKIPNRGEIHEVFVRDPDGVMLNFSYHGSL